jgi:group I intron endonuclease
VSFYVYLIQNRINGKCYVGKANDPEARWQSHKYAAQENKRWYLYRAIRKHGIENFEFSVLEEWPTEEQAFQAEHELIVYLRAIGADLYNETNGGEGLRGLKRTPQHCRRISETKKRIFASPEGDITRERMGASQRGKKRGPRSAETRRKIGIAARNQKPEALRRIGDGARRRWQKYRAWKALQPPPPPKVPKPRDPISEETRQRLRDAQRRRFERPEEHEKIRRGRQRQTEKMRAAKRLKP